MSRLCRGCSHPPRHLPSRTALNCTALLRQDGDEGLPPPFELSAPHGARVDPGSDGELVFYWPRRQRLLDSRPPSLDPSDDGFVVGNVGTRAGIAVSDVTSAQNVAAAAGIAQ